MGSGTHGTKIFLSYAASDRALAHRIANQLRAAGSEIWMDDEELAPGDNFALQIGQALEQSDAMVVLITPNTMDSEWVQHEIDYALGNQRFKDRVIPVYVGPVEDKIEDQAPWILKRLHGVRVADPSHTDQAAREIQQALA